ncbi:hypothetical protein OAK75_14200 [Bacteriovoracales bacterium]|nr:hypothetical protein [Bacteriovoracales bacterium]
MILFLNSLQLMGREVKLFEIISEPEGNKKHVLAFTVDDEGDILKASRRSTGSVQNFSVDELNEGGVVLYRAEGRNAIKLSSNSFDRIHGGDVLMTYLSDGITNIYNKFPIVVERVGDLWVAKKDGKKIRKLILKSRMFFGKVIGIREIIVKH